MLNLHTTHDIRAVLFDLDGTLADTAPDLALSLNLLRREQGLPALSLAQIRPEVSHGSTALLRLGFGLEAGQPEYAPLRERLLEIYLNHLDCETRLFPGMDKLLARLEAQHIKWGVVTNKPASLTEPLMSALGLDGRAACIISGDSTAQRKPHPEPMLQACRIIDVPGTQCLYIGDARRDIEAGNHAGMKTLVALFGYLATNDSPETWQADGMISHPLEIIDWLSCPGA